MEPKCGYLHISWTFEYSAYRQVLCNESSSFLRSFEIIPVFPQQHLPRDLPFWEQTSQTGAALFTKLIPVTHFPASMLTTAESL
jgi:hypothetical protein